MRILWANLSRARRELIDSQALDQASFLSRLWYHHLFWTCSFTKTASGIYLKRIGRIFTTLYYKSADRILGGTRYQMYLEKRQKAYECLRSKIRDLKAEQQTRAECRFEREMLYQALTNPNFVATPHTHQDR